MMKWYCTVAVMMWGVFSSAVEVSLIDREIRIPRGENHLFEFGTVPQQGTTVLLTLETRLDATKTGGSMYFMKIVLNGTEVRAARSRSAVRLVNRPVVSPVATATPAPWYGGSWRVLYAPDFESALKMDFYVGNPYRLVFDVTDLTNPAAENRLEIANVFPPNFLAYAGTSGDLVIRLVQVNTQPEPSPMMTAAADYKPIINRGEPGAGPAPVEMLPKVGGGMILKMNGQQWPVISKYSFPNSGINVLAAAEAVDRSGESSWKVTVERANDGFRVSAGGAYYQLSRRVRKSPRRIEISDTLTNTNTKEALGMLVEHSVPIEEPGSTAVRLAGNPDPAIDMYYSPPNPSVHIAFSGQGLGLLCEDDVFRNQARLFCGDDGKRAGIRTSMLRLGPGETYTMRWALYPVAGPDYYDFVNLVREDWGANFTVEGPWTFFNPDTILQTSVEDIREKFRRLGIRYAVYCGGWVDRKHDAKRIGFGTGVMDDYWADFRERLRRAGEKIRTAVPECKVLVYYDSQRDTSEGGHERLHDSWLTNSSGKQLSTEWSGRYSLTWSVVATLENTFGKEMLKVADRYLSDIKADGLYWDEMENVAYGTPLITYNAFDGHSCILDSQTYTIEREIGLTTLLGREHRLEVIRRTRANGGFVMGNGPPTNGPLLRSGVPRMVEIQHNDVWCHEGDFSTPLGYASSRMDFGNWIRAIGMAKLLVGTRYTYEHEISPYVFPFTPIELHHGYLLGKERIITIHDGNYGWPGSHNLVTIHHFDSSGKRQEGMFTTTINASEVRTAIEVGEGEAVVLERLPIEFMPAGDQTGVVRRARTLEKGFHLYLEAPNGGSLVAVAEGDAMADVRMAGAEARVQAAENGKFHVTVPPGFAGEIIMDVK